uniref:Uncharacterized protein n=1 Tax=Pristionchus pacificus TaxID=54126 RepID=A0A2A6D032_PRIPA|eukprot:PDM83759.1 hypothetical protein PRIPAC_30246 [Pristionchus pacificus]
MTATSIGRLSCALRSGLVRLSLLGSYGETDQSCGQYPLHPEMRRTTCSNDQILLRKAFKNLHFHRLEMGI